MTGQIKMANIPGIAKSINFNNVQVKDIGQDKCTISFEFENYEENAPVFITLNNMTRKEITTAMNKVDTHYEYVLDGLNSNSRYSFYLSAKSAKNEFLSNIYSFTTIKITVYGVRVDESQSNPANAVTYIEDAVGISPGNNTGLGGWADKFPFNQIKIVGFNNGQVTKELKKENKLQYIDGTPFNSNTDEDIMVQIPKIYWDVKTITNGYEIRISDKKFNDTCDCYAHKVCGIEKNYNYYGAFGGHVGGAGKLRSIPNVALTTSKSLESFRTAAEARGKGCCQNNYYQNKLISLLSLISHKNLNTQISIGKGCSYGNSNKVNSGGSISKGFIYGEQGGKQQMCYLGIEDFYGNLLWWIDGIKMNSSMNVKTISDNYSFSTDSKYESLCTLTQQNGFLSKVLSENKTLFLPKQSSGANTTYYTDKTVVISGNNYVPVFGGHYSDNLWAGSFSYRFNVISTSTGSNRGSRLCYLGIPMEAAFASPEQGPSSFTTNCTNIRILSDNRVDKIEFTIERNGEVILNEVHSDESFTKTVNRYRYCKCPIPNSFEVGGYGDKINVTIKTFEEEIKLSHIVGQEEAIFDRNCV